MVPAFGGRYSIVPAELVGLMWLPILPVIGNYLPETARLLATRPLSFVIGFLPVSVSVSGTAGHAD